jgi:hypothetical protein
MSQLIDHSQGGESQILGSGPRAGLPTCQRLLDATVPHTVAPPPLEPQPTAFLCWRGGLSTVGVPGDAVRGLALEAGARSSTASGGVTGGRVASGKVTGGIHVALRQRWRSPTSRKANHITKIPPTVACLFHYSHNTRQRSAPVAACRYMYYNARTLDKRVLTT